MIESRLDLASELAEIHCFSARVQKRQETCDQPIHRFDVILHLDGCIDNRAARKAELDSRMRLEYSRREYKRVTLEVPPMTARVENLA
jgi:hypothetical protein